MSARRTTQLVMTAIAVAGLWAAQAAPSTSAPASAPATDKLVCGSPSTPGYAACRAHVRTDARTAKPLATSTYANGLTPVQRTVADVAAVADPATGVAVYSSYGSTGGLNWYVFGGTSVAAPIIGAIFARDGVTATPASGLYTNRSDLFDVTSGSNGRCVPKATSTGAYLCYGVAGYDGPSGNGVPNGVVPPF